VLAADVGIAGEKRRGKKGRAVSASCLLAETGEKKRAGENTGLRARKRKPGWKEGGEKI